MENETLMNKGLLRADKFTQTESYKNAEIQKDAIHANLETQVKVLEDEIKRQKKKKLKEREKHRMTKTLLQETEEVLELAQTKNLELV